MSTKSFVSHRTIQTSAHIYDSNKNIAISILLQKVTRKNRNEVKWSQNMKTKRMAFKNKKNLDPNLNVFYSKKSLWDKSLSAPSGIPKPENVENGSKIGKN